MAKEKVTIWKVVHSRVSEHLELMSGEGTRTPKQVRLDAMHKAWNYGVLVPIEEAYFTPEAAIAAFHKSCDQAIEIAQKKLDEAVALRQAKIVGVPEPQV